MSDMNHESGAGFAEAVRFEYLRGLASEDRDAASRQDCARDRMLCVLSRASGSDWWRRPDGASTVAEFLADRWEPELFRREPDIGEMAESNAPPALQGIDINVSQLLEESPSLGAAETCHMTPVGLEWMRVMMDAAAPTPSVPVARPQPAPSFVYPSSSQSSSERAVDNDVQPPGRGQVTLLGHLSSRMWGSSLRQSGCRPRGPSGPKGMGDDTEEEGDGEERDDYEEDEDEADDGKRWPFMSARAQLLRDSKRETHSRQCSGGNHSGAARGGGGGYSSEGSGLSRSRSLGAGPGGDAPRGGSTGGARGKTLGLKRRFVPPSRIGDDEEPGSSGGRSVRPRGANARDCSDSGGGGGKEGQSLSSLDPEDLPDALKNLEPRMIEMIENEIMDGGDPISFDDIAGLEHAKRSVIEMVVWPMQRPDLFTGLRSLPKGVLLFGPPGTGKTLIGKAVAHQCGATFFCISASSLTSKWIGEGEKMVRTLFAVASVKQPSVIFIDEIDSLLTSRTDAENESSRRIKTEFLVQLDGASTKSSDLVIVVGATNRPQELDEAARRRFVKRLYIPLPDSTARRSLVTHLLTNNHHSLSAEDIELVTTLTKGFSGADVAALCKEAAMGPVRAGLAGLRAEDIHHITADSVPAITLQHFHEALRQVRPSVATEELRGYVSWNADFGSFPIDEVVGGKAAETAIGQEQTGSDAQA